MYVYECIYEGVYVCMNVCMYVCMYVCMGLWLCLCVCVESENEGVVASVRKLKMQFNCGQFNSQLIHSYNDVTADYLTTTRACVSGWKRSDRMC